MKTNPLALLAGLGQSVWYDNIHRAMIESGELARMVGEDDLRGVTSNPTIFEKAITGGNDYDQALAQLVAVHPEYTSRDYFFALAVDDIRAAADVLRPVYDATDGVDGMVSLEVSPDLAHDTQGSIAEARRLYARLDRPNVMIKIPATVAGIPVVEQLINDGINVNVTLLFSVERYAEAAWAYLRGLAARHQRGEAIDRVTSVASFFVSRVDTALDKVLEERLAGASTEQQGRIRAMQGQGAIANAKLAYLKYHELYNTHEAVKLKEVGARPQRLLWASTGVKSPHYSDVRYIDALIGPDTVNTIPPATYQAFKDHGTAQPTLEQDIHHAPLTISALKTLGLDLPAALERLEREGVAAFAMSFDNLLQAIEQKVGQIGRPGATSAA